MEDLDNINDIPEGVARIEAMEHAMKTAISGEDPRSILIRAAMYYSFLTTGRAEIMATSNQTMGLAN